MTAVDTGLLEVRVKDMYRHVAREPQGTFHFEMGRNLAERLGYPMDRLSGIPSGAIESFAGVGYFFDLVRWPRTFAGLAATFALLSEPDHPGRHRWPPH